MTTADPLITVCRDPRDHKRARVHLSALDAFGFDAFSDGERSRFSRAMLVAFVAPTAIVDGELHRPASHGPAADRVKVAITRTHNQSVYPILERMAAAARIAELAPVPRRRVRLNAPAVPSRPVTVAATVATAPAKPARIAKPVAPAKPRVRCEDAPAGLPLNVAAIREGSGLEPPAFADRVGVSLATLYAWEAGRRTPRAASRERLFAMVSRTVLNPGARL